MSQRTVKAILKADVSGLVASMRTAAKATDDFAKKASKSATDNKEAWDKTGKGMMVAGGAIAIGVGFAVKAFMDFDKEMSGVKAVSGANAQQMDLLGKAALKAGADTVFSASEAAKAEAELAKAGVSTADILGGALTGSLNLASAGGLDLAQAATIAAQSMNIFKLEGKDVAHIADVLASGANKSAADVGSLGDALKQGGLVAAQTGLHLEDTVGVLSMFADSALVGSDAGTSLKTMLQRLVPTSDAAQGAMDAIGFSAYDASGKFVGMESVAQQLKDGLGGLSEEQRAATMNTIFGSDAVRAASILYDKGAVGVKDYTAAMNDQGAAARMSATMLDNLSGDLEALKGSIETALIQAGSGGNDVLRDMAGFATTTVNAFGGLPAPIQGSIVKVAALGGAVLITGGALVTFVPKAVAAKVAITDMGIMAGRSGTAIRGLGLAAGVALVALPLLGAAAGKVSESLGQLAPNADEAGRAWTALASGGKATGESADLLNRHFDDLANTINNVFNPNLGHKVNAFFSQISPGNLMGFETSETNQSIEFFKSLDSGLTKMVSSGNGDKAAAMFSKITAEATKQGYSIDSVRAAMPGYTAALDTATVATTDAGRATAIATGQTKGLILSEKELADAAEKAKKTHDALTDSITGFGSAMLAARGDARSYEAAIDAASASVKENGRTLDITTAKGRANAAALDAISTSALKSAESNLENAEANGTLAATSVKVATDVGKARTAFINTAVSMGMSRVEAGKLATAQGLTSSRVQGLTDKLIDLGRQKPNPTVNANTVPAATQIKAIQARIDAIKQGKAVGINANTAAGRREIARLQAEIDALRGKDITIRTTLERLTVIQTRKGTLPGDPRRATGGLLHGPGTGTSDSIPLWGSDGEYMVKAAAVEKYGVSTLDAINSMRFAAGGHIGSRADGRGSYGSTAPNVSVDLKVYPSAGMDERQLAKAVIAELDGVLTGGLTRVGVT